MSPTTEQVLQAALSLPPGDRFELLEALLAAEQSPPAPLEETWRDVVRRRSEELDSGAVKGIPWAEVHERMPRGTGRDG